MAALISLSSVIVILKDHQYLQAPTSRSEKPHRYGRNVHLVADPFFESLLLRFSEVATIQPDANRLATELSKFLMIQAVNSIFPTTRIEVKTRMLPMHPEGEFEALTLRSDSRAVVVDLMRAGILPSQVCFETLHQILKAENIRQDHVLLNRAVNAKDEVTGVQMSGYKIGGDVKDAYVFLPDPMGATGSTIAATIELYKNLEKVSLQFKGQAKKFIALHFIVTPEYLKRLKPYANDLEIFALRLDRGLSSGRVLNSELGEFWEEERGLNEKQYIVPGAGGIGEILNNSFC
jgi:uracil phosphoribosyltransferase